MGAAPLFAQTTGYTISTFAGNGTSGFSGDGGPANAAALASAYGVTVDSAGNLYIVDNGNQRIRKVSNGTINTIAGNGIAGFAGDTAAATSAELHDPLGVAVDSSGNFYIADTNNNLIRKVSSGTITTYAGNINSPPGYADNTQATLGYLQQPTSVAVDAAGNVYFCESANGTGGLQGNNRIRKVSTSGVLTTIANNSNGTIGSSGDGGPATAAHLNNPLGIAVDKAGNLYIADTGNHKIRRIAVNGIITTVAGTGFPGFSGDGGLATSAQLNNPTGVSVDAAGNLYIADNRNFRIRMVSANGTITTIAGKASSGYSGDGGAATDAQLKFPTGTAVDSAGNVYVADNQNSAIRLLTPPAPAGSGGPPAIGTGGVVSAAAFGGFASIAPGSWIEIYGTNLAADTSTWDGTGGTAPTTLSRTSVSIGGPSAFLDYVSPGQVNAQVPSNVLTGTQPIVVTTAVGPSAGYNITVNGTQPGMLAPASFLIGGKQYVVAQFPDRTYVLPPNAIPGLPSRQAKPGETIVIYGVGFGPVIPSIPAGQIVQQINSLALPVQVSIGGAPTALPYYGLAPTLVGLYQFNIVVPSIPDNDAAPLAFTLNGASGTQTLFTAVKN